MKLNLSALRPFEAKRLSADLKQGTRTEEFLAALRDFLGAAIVDPISEGDYIKSTAIELSSAGVFDNFDAKKAKTALRDLDPKTLKIFTENLPGDVARSFRTAASVRKAPLPHSQQVVTLPRVTGLRHFLWKAENPNSSDAKLAAQVDKSFRNAAARLNELNKEAGPKRTGRIKASSSGRPHAPRKGKSV